jgi:hypothetical protein
MIAGNRRAGSLVIAFAVALLCLSLLAVVLTHWKTRRPVPQKSITGTLSHLALENLRVNSQLSDLCELKSRRDHSHGAT